MPSIFKKLKGAGAGNALVLSSALPRNKKDRGDLAPELTPLEKLLQDSGPIREDGSDKFFGLENFGNTCYCNSIVQALYYSPFFRENVVNYPPHSPPDSTSGKSKKVNVTIRAPAQQSIGRAAGPKGQKPATAAEALKQKQAINGAQTTANGQCVNSEDKPESPEYKKKRAMIKGPVLELAAEKPGAFGVEESTFTGLKEIFTALIESETRTGVLSPQRFLDIFKRQNEMFRNSMHQDAHEFYGLVLNDVIASVEANGRRMREREAKNRNGLAHTVMADGRPAPDVASPGTGWVHDIFEGVLTSETRCLTCETASQRDETFLDLSIDLEEHSSVTACLSNFSAEEMLCERNKFHCDHCGGLQEAEKRMKIKKLPRVLALHLKRFKYTEDYSRLQKLFHRVVYPYYLRMFNTTDDAQDPDRIYELYAVVVHIGGNAYHGHYVAVIKTQDRGWLLFDDEMVEPVDKHFVRNFFGDKPGMACAYVLFYQETTFDKMRAEQDAEGLEEACLVSQKADMAAGDDQSDAIALSPLIKTHLTHTATPPRHNQEAMVSLDHAQTAPGAIHTPAQELSSQALVAVAPPPPTVMTEADEAVTKAPTSAKKETKYKISREKKELAQLQRVLQESKETAKQKRPETTEQAARGGGLTNGESSGPHHGNENGGHGRPGGSVLLGLSSVKSFPFLVRGSGEKGKERTERKLSGRQLRRVTNKDKERETARHSMTTATMSTNASEAGTGGEEVPDFTRNANASPPMPTAGPPTSECDNNAEAPPKVRRDGHGQQDKTLRQRFSFSLGRKKSMRLRP